MTKESDFFNQDGECVAESSLRDFRRFIQRVCSLKPLPEIPRDILQVIGPELYFSGQPRSSRESWYQTARVWALIHALPPTGRSLILTRQTGWPGLPLALRGRAVVIPGFPLTMQGNSLTKHLDIGNVQTAPAQALSEFHPSTFSAVVLSRQYLAHGSPATILPHVARLLLPGGSLAFIDEGPVGTEFRSHLVLSNERKKQQVLLFVLGFPKEQRREYYAFRLSNAGPLTWPEVPIAGGPRRKPPFHPWKAALTEVQDQITRVDFWEDTGAADLPSAEELLTCLGLRQTAEFPDPALLCRDFLRRQALHFPDHPFLQATVFDNICSGLGQLAVLSPPRQGEIGFFRLAVKEKFCHAVSSVA